MKKAIYLVAALVVVNLGIAMFSCKGAEQKTANESDSTEVVETFNEVAVEESKSCAQLYQETVYGEGTTPNCHAGGKLAYECKIEAGQNLNGMGDLTTGCSVTCQEGYYACCSYECHCIPASEWE